MLHTKFRENRLAGSGEEDFLRVFTIGIYGRGGHLGHVTRGVIDIGDIDISIKISCDIDIDIEIVGIDILNLCVTPVMDLASLTTNTI